MAIHTIMEHQGIKQFYHGNTADLYRRYLIKQFLKHNIAQQKSNDQSTVTDENSTSKETNKQDVIVPNKTPNMRGKNMDRMRQ